MMNFSNQSSLLPLLLIIWIRIRVHKVAEYGSNFSLDHWLEHFVFGCYWVGKVDYWRGLSQASEPLLAE